MRVSEPRFNRDLRSFHLALWMISRSARPSTIAAWTGISYRQVTGLYKTHAPTTETGEVERRRGPPPTHLNSVLISPGLRSEAAVIGAFLRLFDVVPEAHVANAREQLPNLNRGEQLRLAFDLFHQAVPQLRLSLEQAVVVAYALAEGERWSVGFCDRCRSAILVDCHSLQRRVCVHCQQDRKAGAAPALEVIPTQPESSDASTPVQPDLFANLTETPSQGTKTHKGMVEGKQQYRSDPYSKQCPKRNRG
jgi:hypothetical protein